LLWSIEGSGRHRGDVVVLLRAHRAADADGADDSTVHDQRHSALQRRRDVVLEPLEIDEVAALVDDRDGAPGVQARAAAAAAAATSRRRE
jgi:hypothetical protein